MTDDINVLQEKSDDSLHTFKDLPLSCCILLSL